MSASLKRVCHQTVRHSPRCQFRFFDVASRPSTRCLSSTSSNIAIEQPGSLVQNLPKLNPEDADPEYETDDISALAHSEIQQHRELRQFARTAAWEMPLLSQFARPYEAPEHSQLPLRWRYTAYMGEAHPASRKVVLEIRLSHLWQNPSAGFKEEKQKRKFIKLAGARIRGLDTDSPTLKMSCESFETQAQNKRYLGDVLHAMIKEAKDPQADDFEDVPVDTRHLRKKKTPSLKFPQEWLLTAARKRELQAIREAKMLEEGKKAQLGEVVSGLQQIDLAKEEMQRKALLAAKEEQAIAVPAAASRDRAKGGARGGAGGQRGGMQRNVRSRTGPGMKRR